MANTTYKWKKHLRRNHHGKTVSEEFVNRKAVIYEDDSPALAYWKLKHNQGLAKQKLERLRMIKDAAEGKLL